jgi:DNA adenine methylase
VSQRRVAIYCKEGRIEGSFLMGRMWLIPKDAKKLEDPRRVRKMGQDKK